MTNNSSELYNVKNGLLLEFVKEGKTMYLNVINEFLQEEKFLSLPSELVSISFQEGQLSIQANEAVVFIVNHQEKMICRPSKKEAFTMRNSDFLLLKEKTYFEFLVPDAKTFHFDLFLFEEIDKQKVFLDHILKYPIFNDFFTSKVVNNFFLYFKNNASEKIALTIELLKIEPEHSINQMLSFMLLLSQLHEAHYHSLSIFDSNMMPNNQAGAILSYMVANCETVTLTTTAAHFNYNPNYFSTLCKKLLKATFSEKLVQIRLEKAAYLLDSTDLKVMDIATSVGFNDFSYFHKSFKKRYGISPKKYQKTD